MKKITTLLILLAALSLIACDKPANNGNLKNHDDTLQPGSNPDPITKEDITRLALRDIRHLLLATKRNKKLDVSGAENTHAQAQKAFDDGDFEKAQNLATDTRLQLEKLIIDDL